MENSPYSCDTDIEMACRACRSFRRANSPARTAGNLHPQHPAGSMHLEHEGQNRKTAEKTRRSNLLLGSDRIFKWINLTRLFLILAFLGTIDPSAAKRTRLYMMPGADCKSNQVRQIDAAAVQSKTDVYATDPCFLKFKSDDSMVTDKQLMINFEKYSITSCNVILEIFYGTTAVGQPNVRLTCQSRNPGIIDTKSRYVTFKLLRRGSQDYDFKIVLTTYRKTLHSSCSELMCSGDVLGERRCINSDLRCDGYDNCFEGSDEAGCSRINNGDSKDYFSLGLGALVGIVFTVTSCCVCCVIVACVCRRRRRRRKYRGHVTGAPPEDTTSGAGADQVSPPPAAPTTTPPVAPPQNPLPVQPYTGHHGYVTHAPPPAYTQPYPAQHLYGPPPGLGPPVYAPPGQLPPPQQPYYAPPLASAPPPPPFAPPPPYNPAYAPPYPGGVAPPNVSYNVGQQIVNIPPL